jgi:hypothetical protein
LSKHRPLAILISLSVLSNVFPVSLASSLIHAFFDANLDDGTLTQIAKVKACIRELAKETGSTFESTERDIKIASGLCFDKDGEAYCRSFADCSKDELSLTIQTIIERGDFVGINFR